MTDKKQPKERVIEIPPEQVEVLPPLKQGESFESDLRKELDDLILEFNEIDQQRSMRYEHMFGPVTVQGKERLARQKQIAERVQEIARKLHIEIDVKI